MQTDFIRWFRGASPYINAHRGGTFVVQFGGEMVANARFSHLIHDLSQLHALGIRLILVHGTRPQVTERLNQRGIIPQMQDGLRVTDDAALNCVQDAAGCVRTQIEAALSMGLANSPMAYAQVRVVSGNFVTARPIGVKDGVDFAHTGRVRRVDADAIRRQLDDGAITLLSPLGYSPTGEVFNLSALDVATAVAAAVAADKLLCLTDSPGLMDPCGELIRELSPTAAQQWATANTASQPELCRTVKAACAALGKGVRRAHLLDRQVDGVLLLELFSRDGIGTLISGERFEETRAARLGDIGGILELIAPLETAGVLTQRSRERLEMEIADFMVMERDGMIIACAACHPADQGNIAELACLAVHGDYQHQGRGDELLNRAERELSARGITQLFALTTQTAHWFLERGFAPGNLADLPVERQNIHNLQRNAKVYLKDLNAAQTAR